MVVSNPVASRVSPRTEQAVLAELARVAEVELVRTERPLHAAELAAAAADDHVDAVIVLGGDGTVNEVLNGIGARVPVGVLPSGGTSVLARAMGLPRDIRAAARQIGEALQHGRERHLVLGVLNGRRFAFAAGVGLDALIVRRIDARGRRRGRRPGDAAFAFELARTLVTDPYRAPQGTLRAGGREDRVAFVIAAKVHPWTYVGPLPLKAAPLAQPEGGLDLLASRRLLRRDVPRLARYLFVTGGHAHGHGDPRIVYHHDLDEAVLDCDVPLPAQVDGDDVGDVTEARFGVDREGARLLV